MSHPLRAFAKNFAVLLVAALPLAGCKQALNDRCQIDSDCGENLKCVLGPTMQASAGGTCQNQGEVVMNDMVTPVDAAGTPPPDLAMTPDMLVPGADLSGDMTPLVSDGGDMTLLVTPDLTVLIDLLPLPDLLPKG